LRDSSKIRLWLKLASSPEVSRRAIKVALVVGTVLTAINQGDVIFGGGFTAATLGKIALTYCVPYCVSTFAAVEAILQWRGAE